MTESLKVAGRARVLLLCACALAALGAWAAVPPVVAARQNQNQKPAQPKKKKLPPGTRGFDNYANRDASDKLATGGATRGCQEQTFDGLIECGKGHYEAGAYANAAEAFSAAARLQPARFRGHYYLGMAHEANKDYAAAVAAYRRAAALRPDESAGDDPLDIYRAQNNMANSYALTNNHAEAVKAYRQLLTTLPAENSDTVHYNLGLSLSALSRPAEAVAAFVRATEIRPGYAEAHFNLGVARAKLEQYPQAVAAFRRALEVRPDYAEARHYLGLVHFLTDDRAGLAEQHRALAAMKSPLAAELSKLLGK